MTSQAAGTPVSDKSKIMIVDDMPLNRQLLCAVLDEDLYELVEASSGEEALQMMGDDLPDLVLLDVMMPGMGGFEVCRVMKESAQWRHIPIIVITALNEAEDYVRAIECGADDFMSKPFNNVVLRARIRSYLSAKQMSDEVRKLQKFRYELLRMISHDFNNYFGAVLGAIELLSGSEELQPRHTKWVRRAHHAIQQAGRLLTNFLDIEKIESKELKPTATKVNVTVLVTKIIDEARRDRTQRDIEFRYRHGTIVTCNTDAELLRRTLENLIDNAIRYSDDDSQVVVECEKTPDGLRLAVANHGDVLMPEELDHVFDRFNHIQRYVELERGGTGLGLAFCKTAVDALGGTIRASSPAPEWSDGVYIEVTLPADGVPVSKPERPHCTVKQPEAQPATHP